MREPKTMTAEQAFSRLATLCARAEYCQHDMLERMRRWGLSDEDQAMVMQRLTEGRYVDDERFCRAFVSDKVKYNKWGRRKVEQALWMKRIDADICRRVLDETDTEDYAAVLRPLLQQKRRSVKASSPYELRTKLVKWALGRGFSMDVIRQCIDDDDEEYAGEYGDDAYEPHADNNLEYNEDELLDEGL